ncbi:MAG: ATP-binding protein [Paludibacteraceae bacterium]|nr:ATP-binding protein [Paludibacteraceae bacterium]
MDISKIQQIIVTNRNQIPSIEIVERSFDFDENVNYVLTGVRQAGKSYLMFQRIQSLLRAGTPIEQILYINFDDERLLGFATEDLDLILQAHYQMSEVKPILFFDELQNIEGWEKFARRLANEKYRIFITGSNAKMLSAEFVTILGGRYMMMSVFPYSFNEYICAGNFKLEGNWQYDINCLNHVKRLFSEYFHFGGFPESRNVQQKRSWLSSLFKKMLLGDVIARNGIKNSNSLLFLSKKLAESVGQPVSYTRMSNLVSSLGEKAQTNTMIDYVRYMEDACILFSVRNITRQFAEKEGNKKYYYCDNGILELFLLDGNTSLLENIVAVELKRYYGDDFYFYNDNVEVDFVIPERELAIQVSYSLGDEMSETYERETQALIKLSKRLPYNNLLILTYDEEKTFSINGKEIEVKPVWKWMLQNSRRRNV